MVTQREHGMSVPVESTGDVDKWFHMKTGRVFHRSRPDEERTEPLISFFYVIFTRGDLPLQIAKCTSKRLFPLIEHLYALL